MGLMAASVQRRTQWQLRPQKGWGSVDKPRCEPVNQGLSGTVKAEVLMEILPGLGASGICVE